MAKKFPKPCPNRPGPKYKVDALAKAEVIAILTAGASLKDAAGYLGIAVNTLSLERKRDREFRNGVIAAQKDAKLRLIRKVGSSKAWQSAAWMLERRYGAEYGRKDKQEITGKFRTQTNHKFDFADLTDEELLKFERAAASRTAGTGAPGRN